jgi:hypothetical protein
MFSSPAGVWIRNHILVDVAFADALSLSAALDHVMTLLRFFELIGGRPQNIDMINVAVGGADQEAWLDLYWCLPPKRRSAWEHRPPHPSEILVDVVRDRSAFEQMLSRWIALDDDRLQARVRFSSGFGQQRSFSIDRLVGAANMFDILPDNALPAKIPLSDEVKRAKHVAREAFKALPASDERDTILNALGRLGSRTLRQKIRHRAVIASSAMLQPLASLDVVVDEAVKCRNHFVHGSPGSFDYFAHGGTMNFLTSALEFLFAAADLVDAGWDATAWQQRGGVLAHPFSETLYEWERCASQIVALRANPGLAPADE